MEISLRKAAALQESIVSTIKTLEFTPSVDVNEFEEPGAILDAASEKVSAVGEAVTRLIEAKYQIRRLVARANVEAGVSDLLADLAELNEKLSHINRRAAAPARLSEVVLLGKIEILKKVSPEHRGQGYGAISETISTGVLTQDEIDEAAHQAYASKRAIESTKENLLSLNVKTNIVLSEEVVQILQDHMLI